MQFSRTPPLRQFDNSGRSQVPSRVISLSALLNLCHEHQERYAAPSRAGTFVQKRIGRNPTTTPMPTAIRL